LNSLTQSILTRYGIDFTCYEPKSLKRRIIRALNLFDFKSVHELWVKLLRDAKFIHSLTNEISVGMTSMFRDPILWKNLRKRISATHRHSPALNIWHAGCSTGEEVYTMGIILKEIHLAGIAKAHCSDINQAAMAEAQGGVYHKIKMIENEANYKEYNVFGDFSKYYVPDGKHVQMSAELISHASFHYHNLITDPFPKGFDIILCRNVMIYFDNAAKIKLLNKFYESLAPGGLFIIGFFDTMGHLMDNHKFELVDEEAKIFKKVG